VYLFSVRQKCLPGYVNIKVKQIVFTTCILLKNTDVTFQFKRLNVILSRYLTEDKPDTNPEGVKRIRAKVGGRENDSTFKSSVRIAIDLNCKCI